MATTVASDYSAGGLVSIDLSNQQVATLLGPESIGSDAFVRIFQDRIYVVNRDYIGNNNNLLILDVNTFEPTCENPTQTNCQMALGEQYNAHDLWVVNRDLAYINNYKTNQIQIINPYQQKILGNIDVAASEPAKTLGLNAFNQDGSFELDKLYAVDKYLFASMQMLSNFAPFSYVEPQPCTANPDLKTNYAPARVAVIDTQTQQVIKIITLSGSNVSTDFIQDAKTKQLWISTTGPQGHFANEACHGIESIDPVSLTYQGILIDESFLGGSVMAFTQDKLNQLWAYVTRPNQGSKVTYALIVKSSQDNKIDTLFELSAPKEILSFGPIIKTEQSIWVGMPFSIESHKTPSIDEYSIQTHQKISTISLSQIPYTFAIR